MKVYNKNKKVNQKNNRKYIFVIINFEYYFS